MLQSGNGTILFKGSVASCATEKLKRKSRQDLEIMPDSRA
jgi:hypothetical protein